MKRLLLLLASLLFWGAAWADETTSTSAPPPAAPAQAAPADAAPMAHPALWKVAGKNCTVYLFGSVHILSPNLKWRDARIAKAIGESDTFFFETALDSAAVMKYIGEKGMLPPGQSLRAMLSPEAQKDLDDDLATLGIEETFIDGQRPWLAMIAMVGLQYTKLGLSPAAGVDINLTGEAAAGHKTLRYFETMEQQMALIAPDDPKLEVQSFEMFLKDFKQEKSDAINPMVDAWAAGDTDKLDALFSKGFAKHPEARKAMLDNRNKAWVKILKGVLDDESGTIFVTVGAGHLIGKGGVPTLLAKAGYKVERI